MDTGKILSHVDYTLLKAVSGWEEIQRLCETAIRFHTASVCIPPCYVPRVRRFFGGAVRICTVTGFPLGYQTTTVKVAESREAIVNGASEIDMAVNLTQVKNGDWNAVRQELSALRDVTSGSILKVIVEACYLTEEEKIRLCEIITEEKADYIKTSTGFGAAGAALEDIRLFRRRIGPRVKIKAAGGIRTRRDMEAFLAEGCRRIGASAIGELTGEPE